MTIPPHKLFTLLPAGTYTLRGFHGQRIAEISDVEAMVLAHRGEVEGVATRVGRLKHLRQLPHAQREDIIEVVKTPKGSSGEILAQTHIGAYRQHLGDSGCWCWALCQASV